MTVEDRSGQEDSKGGSLTEATPPHTGDSSRLESALLVKSTQRVSQPFSTSFVFLLFCFVFDEFG